MLPRLTRLPLRRLPRNSTRPSEVHYAAPARQITLRTLHLACSIPVAVIVGLQKSQLRRRCVFSRRYRLHFQMLQTALALLRTRCRSAAGFRAARVAGGRRAVIFFLCIASVACRASSVSRAMNMRRGKTCYAPATHLRSRLKFPQAWEGLGKSVYRCTYLPELSRSPVATNG